jgi:AmmeMemoRadiSam system protein A
LGSQEREALLQIAHQSVESVVRDRQPYRPPAPALAALNEERGAFVTLNEKGRLRGCIGYVSPVTPLYLTVREVAASAALRDSRFPPVSTPELSSLEYEISVLSPMRRVTDVKQIQVGRDGLLMRNGNYEGLLLPQVPGEYGWDRETFLSETCQKAGMNANCWHDEDTDIFSFTALVFSEHEARSGAPGAAK